MNSQTLIPEGYQPRIADAQIELYLSLFGAVEISGTKWCGKTWSALAHAKSVTYVDRGNNLELAAADPDYVLAGESPHVIDEWQRVPAIWDAVRHAVDDRGGSKGLWLLTGSSTPLQPNAKGHSGAGRIGRIHMHTMTLQESGDSTAKVSLSGLFEGAFEQSRCPNGIRELASLIVRGGWPDEATRSSDAAQIVVRNYLELAFDESVPRFGGVSSVARRVALSLARNLGQSPTHATIARDAFSLKQDEAPNKSQLREVSSYVEILKRLYMIDEVPGWVPASRSPKRMTIKPKRYFADPSLAVGLLGLSSDSLLQDSQTLGLTFENMVMRDLFVYASALPDASSSPLRYYRDDSGLEADVIIERTDGRWAPIEIKLSPDKVDEACKKLLNIEAKVLANDRGQTKAPSFMMVITGTGDTAYKRPDGIYVVPIRALGA